MAIQRYDIRDRHGNFAERNWRPINTPLIDDDGVVIALMHRVDDVALEVRARMAGTIGAKLSLEPQRVISLPANCGLPNRPLVDATSYGRDRFASDGRLEIATASPSKEGV